MSFDVDLAIDFCEHCNRSGDVVCDLNITHNVNEIVERCLVAAGRPVAGKKCGSYDERSWGRLNGWRACDAYPFLDRAVLVAHDPAREAEFLALEPDNKWGSLKGVRTALVKLRDACARYPEGIIRSSG